MVASTARPTAAGTATGRAGGRNAPAALLIHASVCMWLRSVVGFSHPGVPVSLDARPSCGTMPQVSRASSSQWRGQSSQPMLSVPSNPGRLPAMANLVLRGGSSSLPRECAPAAPKAAPGSFLHRLLRRSRSSFASCLGAARMRFGMGTEVGWDTPGARKRRRAKVGSALGTGDGATAGTCDHDRRRRSPWALQACRGVVGPGSEGGQAELPDAGPGLDEVTRVGLGDDVHCVALRLPSKLCGQAMQALRKHVLRIPKIKAVIDDDGSTGSASKLVLIAYEEGGTEEALEEKQDDVVNLTEVADGLDSIAGSRSPALGLSVPGAVRTFAAEHGGELVQWVVRVGYEEMNAVQVLRKLLPPGLEVPSAFEQVGHIAHLNLREELLPHRRLIGEVILDKNPHIRTVVTKLGQIENQFRVFSMHIIAGEPSFITQVRQGGLSYSLDYSKVYWNSRLENEHRLLVEGFAPGEEVWDMFCGIGPFAVPAALKGCVVHANDLNPESFRWCKHNIDANVPAHKRKNIECHNLDARAFVRARARAHQERSGARRVHVIGNLPASAPEFMDAFAGVFEQVQITILSACLCACVCACACVCVCVSVCLSLSLSLSLCLSLCVCLCLAWVDDHLCLCRPGCAGQMVWGAAHCAPLRLHAQRGRSAV